MLHRAHRDRGRSASPIDSRLKRLTLEHPRYPKEPGPSFGRSKTDDDAHDSSDSTGSGNRYRRRSLDRKTLKAKWAVRDHSMDSPPGALSEDDSEDSEYSESEDEEELRDAALGEFECIEKDLVQEVQDRLINLHFEP